MIVIKNLPKHERPREKMVEKGAVNLRNGELLAILLRTGYTGKNVIEVSEEFVRGGNKNKLSDVNRTKILDAFTVRKDIEYFAKLVDNKAIAENDYNIAVSSYVVQEDTREVVDITEINKEIVNVVAR